MSALKSVEVQAPVAPGKVKVFSRQYREKVCNIAANFDLQFDETGHALMDAHKVPQLQAYMRVRPGRLRIVAEDKAPVTKVTVVEIFVGEEPQEEGIALEIIVGEEPQDEGVELEIVVGEEPAEVEDPTSALTKSFFDEDGFSKQLEPK